MTDSAPSEEWDEDAPTRAYVRAEDDPLGQSDELDAAIASLDRRRGGEGDDDVERWEDSDPTAGDVLRRFARAVARTRLRAKTMAAIFLVLALALFVGLRTMKPVYRAEATFRVIGIAFFETPDAQLKEVVRRTYFTQDKLMPIIVQHDLYASRRARAPYLAVESLREDVHIDVKRYEREPGSEQPLALRITLTYEHSEPAIAAAIVDELADLVLTATSVRLQAAHNKVLAEATAADRAAMARLRELASARRMNPDGTGLVDPLRAKQLEERVSDLYREETATEIEAAADAREQALDLVKIDSTLHVRRPRPTVSIALVAAVLSALIAVVLGAVVLGVGAPFVLDERDVEELSLAPLVTVSALRDTLGPEKA